MRFGSKFSLLTACFLGAQMLTACASGTGEDPEPSATPEAEAGPEGSPGVDAGTEPEGDGGPPPGDGGTDPESKPDEAGGVTDPLSVTIPYSAEIAIDPADDEDCFAFTTTERQLIRAETSDGNGDCPGDTVVDLYAAADTSTPIASNDDSEENLCSILLTVEDAGDYIVCARSYEAEERVFGLTFELSTSAPPVCGDGTLVAPFEECDDGNAAAADGCSETCEIEPGYVCETPGALCENLCGNGVDDFFVNLEACDDGNTVDGDGCSADCQTREPGYACEVAGEPCREIICGDGAVEAGFEACDDGNTADGDGCNTDCSAVESGYICPNAGQLCREIICGDGRDDGFAEACDDGNTADGDGCNADCSAVESGYTCPNEGELCRQIECGDGFSDSPEACDDGNTTGGDGCDATCETIEEGFECDIPGFSCLAPATTPANGGDTCEDVATLTIPAAGAGPVNFTVDFTGQANDYDPATCADICGGGPDVLYTFTAGFTGTITFAATGFDTVLYGSEAVCGATPEGFCDDDGGAGTGSLLSINVTSGIEYYLVFDHCRDVADDTGTLTIAAQ